MKFTGINSKEVFRALREARNYGYNAMQAIHDSYNVNFSLRDNTPELFCAFIGGKWTRQSLVREFREYNVVCVVNVSGGEPRYARLYPDGSAYTGKKYGEPRAYGNRYWRVSDLDDARKSGNLFVVVAARVEDIGGSYANNEGRYDYIPVNEYTRLSPKIISKLAYASHTLSLKVLRIHEYISPVLKYAYEVDKSGYTRYNQISNRLHKLNALRAQRDRDALDHEVAESYLAKAQRAFIERCNAYAKLISCGLNPADLRYSYGYLVNIFNALESDIRNKKLDGQKSFERKMNSFEECLCGFDEDYNEYVGKTIEVY